TIEPTETACGTTRGCATTKQTRHQAGNAEERCRCAADYRAPLLRLLGKAFWLVPISRRVYFQSCGRAHPLRLEPVRGLLALRVREPPRLPLGHPGCHPELLQVLLVARVVPQLLIEYVELRLVLFRHVRSPAGLGA